MQEQRTLHNPFSQWFVCLLSFCRQFVCHLAFYSCETLICCVQHDLDGSKLNLLVSLRLTLWDTHSLCSTRSRRVPCSETVEFAWLLECYLWTGLYCRRRLNLIGSLRVDIMRLYPLVSMVSGRFTVEVAFSLVPCCYETLIRCVQDWLSWRIVR